MRVDWLADVLRAAGIPVREMDGWKTRGNGDLVTTIRRGSNVALWGCVPSPAVVDPQLLERSAGFIGNDGESTATPSFAGPSVLSRTAFGRRSTSSQATPVGNGQQVRGRHS